MILSRLHKRVLQVLREYHEVGVRVTWADLAEAIPERHFTSTAKYIRDLEAAGLVRREGKGKARRFVVVAAKRQEAA